ncbi:MAG: aminotransferase class V-fold PLP-dependent enzyme [Verrucomicrobia bacterium]|nr:aminotransferase class V-fold PLP-dependent enzyme [Verrucomicrobiota bacterium]MBS0645379.1 aminotransferase class V-fold PLP-dependent enzyme [Verrucomicrobiota bacterium]
MIYLDHELATPPDEHVIATMKRYMEGQWCGQTAPYAPIHSEEKQAKESIYKLAGADPEDYFVFTSSGAEAVNHVLFSTYMNVTRKTGKHHFMCSALDEAPAILGMMRLEELGGHFQMVKASSEGIVTVKEVAQTLTPRTALLSLSWANGLTGVIQPLEDIVALCEERGILLHVDATHVLGKGHFPFHKCGAHFMTFDGEPLGAPAGTGGMFISKRIESTPLIVGGYEQHSLRAGSLSLPLFYGLAEAAKGAHERADLFCIQSALLRHQFEQALVERLGAKVFFESQMRLPHITALGFLGVTSEALCYLLARRKVYANMGGNRFQQLVNLLKACAISSPLCHGGLSFALGPTTTEEQIALAVQQIVDVVGCLKRYSEHLIHE